MKKPDGVGYAPGMEERMPILNYTTKVDIFTTLGEIQRILVAHGARKIVQDYDARGRIIALSFLVKTPLGEQAVRLPANVDAVYGDVHYVNDNDLGKCVRYYTSHPFHRNWMRFGFMPAHPSFYCRRSVYGKFGTFDLSYKVAADFENLLRLIFVHRIRTRYIAKDFVTMRTGGASSSGLRSHKQIMRDHLRALKQNGVYSNLLLLGMRYPYKVCEIAQMKINNIFHK